MSETIATRRRISVGLSAAAIVALGLAGCSSSSHLATKAAGTPVAALSSSSSSASPSAAQAKAGGSGGGGLSLGGGSFCSIAKKVQAEEDSSAAAATDSPDSLKTLLSQADQELAQFVVIAPSAIKGDVRVLATAEKSFIAAVAAANYDVTKVSPSALTALDTPAVTSATDHITTYLTDECGLVEPTDSAS